jgi:hypothetical protein
MPCSLVYLDNLAKYKVDPRIFSNNSAAQYKWRFSLSLRTSPQKPERSTNLDLYYYFYRYLEQEYGPVVVVPDHDDYMLDKRYRNYDWTVEEDASVSLAKRLDVYSSSEMNIAEPAGWNVLLYLSMCAFILPGYLCKKDPIGNIDFHKRKGPQPFSQPYWFHSEQYIDWSEHSDLNYNYLTELILNKR